MKLTYKFRIKDSNSKKQLARWASMANYVWNYCKQTSAKAWQRDHRCLTGFDLNNLISHSSKELKLPAQTIQAIGEQFARSAKQHRKIPRFRSYKKDLGWIPFKSTSIKILNNSVQFNGKTLNLWKTRPLGGPIKTGGFAQDYLNRWYVFLVIETQESPKQKPTKPVGLDLGMKTHLTDSQGIKYQRPNISKQNETKLATAQRAHKKRQTTKLHQKIKNQRKDWIHKTTTKIAKQYNKIVIGNVKIKQIQQLKAKGFNRSLYDASWFQLKTILKYKAQLPGGEYKEINEAYTTQTCNICKARSGPKGKSQLGIREWSCSKCRSLHDRDHNAALNILRLGHQTLAPRP